MSRRFSNPSWMSAWRRKSSSMALICPLCTSTSRQLTCPNATAAKCPSTTTIRGWIAWNPMRKCWRNFCSLDTAFPKRTSHDSTPGGHALCLLEIGALIKNGEDMIVSWRFKKEGNNGWENLRSKSEV